MSEKKLKANTAVEYVIYDGKNPLASVTSLLNAQVEMVNLQNRARQQGRADYAFTVKKRTVVYDGDVVPKGEDSIAVRGEVTEEDVALA